MASKPSYSEILKDPRWQKKRLEILQRDNWTCSECKATDKTLHVHHCYYDFPMMPWEYRNSSLVTLCEDCHAVETEHVKDIKMVIQWLGESNGFLYKDWCELVYILGDVDGLGVPERRAILRRAANDAQQRVKGLERPRGRVLPERGKAS